MSNLYKTWLVRTENANARVINSDAVVEEYLQKNKQKSVNAVMETVADADGFTQGLFAQEVEGVVVAEPEVDYVQLAKEEAEQILGDARRQAEELKYQASEEVSAIREEAFSQGYQDGKTLMEEEQKQQMEESAHQYQRRMEELESEYCIKRERLEGELVDVILNVFNRVFHIQFDSKKEILLHLIHRAISNIEGEKRFQVRVSRSDIQFLELHKEELLERVGHDMELEILADSMLGENDCIIETDSGVFDCGLGVQLENLIKDIRSLSS